MRQQARQKIALHSGVLSFDLFRDNSADRTGEGCIELSAEQIERYSRQLILPGMGEVHQLRLLQSRVLILGVGGLGSAAAQYLAGAGIGTIGLLDDDCVQLSNLHRQILYSQANIGEPKVEAAKARLQLVNSEIELVVHRSLLDAHNAEGIFENYDLVVDGLDNWQSKLLASDVAMQVGRTLVHAGAVAFHFQVFTMVPGKSACLRCVFGQIGLEDFPPTCGQAGISGPIVGMAGAFQAAEAIKFIAGLGTTSGDELIHFDGLTGESYLLRGLSRRADCPDCGRVLS